MSENVSDAFVGSKPRPSGVIEIGQWADQISSWPAWILERNCGDVSGGEGEAGWVSAKVLCRHVLGDDLTCRRAAY